MAAPRPKKKKAVVKKKTDVKSPAETRKSISRKQMGTNRLQNIINEGAEGRRLPVQESSPKRLTVSQPEKVRMNVMDKLLRQDRKGTPNRAVTPRVINQGYTPGSASRAVVPSTATSASAKIGSSAGSKALTLLRGSGILGAIVSPIADAVPAGEGSTKDKYSTLKKKYSSAIGPKKPTASIRYSEPIGPKKPKGTYSGYGNFNSPKAKSTYSGYGDFKTPKVQSSTTAATTAAASGSNGGGSQAANVAKAGGKAKAKVGKQTKYQRESLAMEQRKSSSGKSKKSIFSLFRKG